MKITKIDNVNFVNASIKNSLASLLITCVEDGASLGFITPFLESEATEYWDHVNNELQSGGRLLLVAAQGEQVIGTVQLVLSDKKNGLHRADIEKLMVHPDVRGKGIAKELINHIENLARTLDRRLLILDTQTGSLASKLYLKLDYIPVGEIPHFALSTVGELEPTCIFYKHF
ncbi:GNAT family N-acetyltransferase [bacterium]|nr:GNAT family N-acetyltransferase [bacterium]